MLVLFSYCVVQLSGCPVVHTLFVPHSFARTLVVSHNFYYFQFGSL